MYFIYLFKIYRHRALIGIYNIRCNYYLARDQIVRRSIRSVFTNNVVYVYIIMCVCLYSF